MFLLLIITLCFVLWLKYKADSRIVRLSSDIPGPPTLPLIGNVHLVPPNGKDALNLRTKWIKEYGNVVRIWIGNILLVFLSDPKDCEVVLKDTNELTKSNIYNFLHPWLGLGLLTSTGEKWRHRRKALTPAFHFSILEQFIDVFNKNGRILVECLESCDQKAVDIQPFISRYALDVICETAMGTQIDAQKNVHSPYVKAVREMCHLISGRIRKPWLYPDILWSLFGYKKLEDKLLATLKNITNKVLKENENIEEENSDTNDFGMKKKTAFLKLLLKMKKEGSNTFKTDGDIREEVNTFMFEGHDTTTSSICFTLSLLVKHPHIQELIYEELKAISTKTTNFKYEDLNEMKYLERVIKESLRLFPSVPVIDRKLDKDMKIPSGYTIPAGSLVAVSIFFSHRNINYYEKPNHFNPDNFLPDIASKRHPYSYIPFSAGPRNCIGQKFAMMELKSVLAKLIMNYKFEPMGEIWDVQLNPDIVLQSMNGHWMKIKKRC